jgi:hypothetical protein
MPNGKLPNDIPRRTAFLEKVYIEDRARWHKFEAQQNRNNAQFKALFKDLKRQGDDLKRQGDDLKRQGDRLEALQKDYYRRREFGNGGK